MGSPFAATCIGELAHVGPDKDASWPQDQFLKFGMKIPLLGGLRDAASEFMSLPENPGRLVAL